jgi:predicted dienelactone hydrolase
MRRAALLLVLLASCSSAAAPATSSAPLSSATTLAAPTSTAAPSTLTEPSTSAAAVTTPPAVVVRHVGDTTVWQPGGDGGPWPLVVFAHGYNTTALTYERIERVWAAAGYVVAGTASNEPDAIVAAIGVMATDPAVDASRIAVAGHSDGATRSVVVGYRYRDPRVKAVVALVSDPLDSPPTLSGPPLLLEQGDADTTSPKETGGDALWAQVASAKWYLVLHGAEHSPPIVKDTPWTPIVDATTIAFLDHYVAGRTSDDTALFAPALAQPSLASLTAG